jgi:hypothetical protein
METPKLSISIVEKMYNLLSPEDKNIFFKEIQPQLYKLIFFRNIKYVFCNSYENAVIYLSGLEEHRACFYYYEKNDSDKLELEEQKINNTDHEDECYICYQKDCKHQKELTDEEWFEITKIHIEKRKGVYIEKIETNLFL